MNVKVASGGKGVLWYIQRPRYISLEIDVATAITLTVATRSLAELCSTPEAAEILVPQADRRSMMPRRGMTRGGRRSTDGPRLSRVPEQWTTLRAARV
jgi:hypothetical protein